MEYKLNELGQPVGLPVPGWSPPPAPPRAPLEGRWCRLEPLDPVSHAEELFQAFGADTGGRLWTYLPYGPFASLGEFTDWMTRSCLGPDPLFFAVINHSSGRAEGVASYLRIEPGAGSIEVGHINYAPGLQRTAAATEAMYLMLRRVFELGYRRYEWKCDSLNEPSRVAALRLGFTFEGLFRQAAIYKGRSRDTAWYSVIDREWPALREAFERWLDPANFDSAGRQRTSLLELTGAVNKQHALS